MGDEDEHGTSGSLRHFISASAPPAPASEPVVPEPNVAALRALAEQIAESEAAMRAGIEKMTEPNIAALRTLTEQFAASGAAVRAAIEKMTEPNLAALSALAEQIAESEAAALAAIEKMTEPNTAALRAAVEALDRIMSAKALDERIEESKKRVDDAKRKALIITGYTTST